MKIQLVEKIKNLFFPFYLKVQGIVLTQHVIIRLTEEWRRNLYNKYGKRSLDTAAKAGPETSKYASKNVVHKTPELTEELIENKTTEKIMKPKLVSDEKKY